VVDGEDQGLPAPDPDDDGLRGWISPDDRLWRHPSEAGGSDRPTAVVVPGSGRPRGAPWIVGGAAVCFVLVLTAVAATIAVTGGANSAPGSAPVTGSLSPTTEAGTAQVPPATTVRTLVADVGPSMVEVTSSGAGGTVSRAGVVVASGGLIVTTAGAVAGARSIEVVEADGVRQKGSVVGVDQRSGLAVVNVADDLPAASFADTDPVPGDLAMAMSLDRSDSPGGTPGVSVYAGTVLSAGRTVDADAETAAFASTVVAASLSPRDVGCPLVAADGDVLGMLETVTRTDGSVASVFLPAELVYGVAEQLVTTDRVEHGSLGVRAVDADPAAVTTTSSSTRPAPTSPVSGAQLVSVVTGGPAAEGGLEPGDVITGLDSAPVHGLAELQTVLYAEPPGATVSITYVRNGSTRQTSAVLVPADSDADASARSPSP
jgi:S1-C subfamily serine protease